MNAPANENAEWITDDSPWMQAKTAAIEIARLIGQKDYASVVDYLRQLGTRFAPMVLLEVPLTLEESCHLSEALFTRLDATEAELSALTQLARKGLLLAPSA